MILSFKDLQDRVLQVLDETSLTSPTTVTLVKSFINQAHQQRCMEFPWNFMLWPRAVTFATVSGQQTYALHEEYHRPLYFRNNTSRAFLQELPNRTVMDMAGDFGGTNQSSSITKFIPWGMQPVSKQPSVAGVITVVSSSTSDTATKTVTIEGELSTGIMASETLAMNGITNVVGTTSFQAITGVTKSTTFVGSMTLSHANTGAILSLSPSQTGKQYKTIFLPDTVTSADTIEYRFYRQPRILVNDYDLPLLPSPHESILVYDALVMMGGYLTDTGGQSLRIWQDRQSSAQMALYQAYANEGQSLNAGAQYISYQGEDL